MKIALLQAAATPLDLLRNLASVREAAEHAREAGAELLLTPELFVTGYAPKELAAWLRAERIAQIPVDVAAVAAEVGIAIVTSFPHAREDGTFAIAAGLWDATGAHVLAYEKVHLWGDEDLAFTPGEAAPTVVEWNGRKVGLQICFDIEFPEPARFIAEKGADLLLVPTAIDESGDYVPDVIIRARAAENAMVVAYADHARTTGEEASVEDCVVDFAGRSIVAGREGQILAQAGRGEELLFADIPSPAPLRDGADYLRARRPDLYARWR
ncbi:MAG: nitrilase-related carbon-nitrogen hydrolase [Leucobacter sp.]